MKKRKDFFEIIKTLNHEELKVYATLDKLSQNMGYIYAGNSYIAKKIDMEKEKLQSIISILIRKKDLFYIKNLSSTDLFFLEEQTEDKYQSELGISYGEEQRKIFQICKEHLMKLMLKEQIKMEKER